MTADFEVSIGTTAADSTVVSVDGVRLGVVMAPPFVWLFVLVSQRPGNHNLAVTVFDGDSQEQLAADVLICHGVGHNLGNYIPNFSLEDLDGNTHTMGGTMSAKAVLLDFWASWCGPCVNALPETQRLHEVYGDRGLQVLSVNEEDREIIESFMLANGYTFPVLLDGTRWVDGILDVSAIPTYFIIDQQGIVRFSWIGSAGASALEEVITDLLKCG